MSDVNKYQVGGDHYKTPYEHWDFVLDTGMGYLEGCATKYVSRWRKKAGLADLQKAEHYIVKLMENHALFLDRVRQRRPSVYPQVERFREANGLSATEAEICFALASWVAPHDIDHALVLTRQLIQSCIDPKSVPATDSNKHAPRDNYGDC
jgi:predicted DNA-binding protein (UPF0278 family)